MAQILMQNNREQQMEVPKPWWELDKKAKQQLWTLISYLIVILVGLYVGRYALGKMEDLDKTARERWQPTEL
eukprot:478717-Prorocentrum_minimum.AAC.1